MGDLVLCRLVHFSEPAKLQHSQRRSGSQNVRFALKLEDGIPTCARSGQYLYDFVGK